MLYFTFKQMFSIIEALTEIHVRKVPTHNGEIEEWYSPTDQSLGHLYNSLKRHEFEMVDYVGDAPVPMSQHYEENLLRNLKNYKNAYKFVLDHSN